MKIAYLQDMDPLVFDGGAQLTDRTHIQAGFKRGHEIQVIVPGANDQYLDKSWDLVIVSNAASFSVKAFDMLRERHIPYVLFHHDYVFLCKWRLFYSMQERCKKDCYLRERWLPTLLGARLNIWLSPLHRQAWLFSYPQIKGIPYVLVPSPVDPTEFQDLTPPHQRAGVVTVNSAVSFKGVENVIKWANEHSDVPITLVGQNPEGKELPANIKQVGQVPYHKMNEIYNKHRTFLHLPSTPQPFERTVAESYLAGCDIIGNKNVGALSWSFFQRGRNTVARNLLSAPDKFWTAVEKCV